MWPPIRKRLRRDMPLLATVAGGQAAGVGAAAGRAAGLLFAADARTLFVAALRAADMVIVCASALIAYRVYLGAYNPTRSEHLQIVIGCLVAANLLHFAQ